MGENGGADEGRGEHVKVNQVGYPPWAEKRGIVSIEASTFAVVDRTTDAVVYRGELSPPIDDPDAGEAVHHAEFSDLAEAGEYVLTVDEGEATSHPFRIEPGVYEPVLIDVGRLYSLKRSNTAIDDPITGLDVRAGHTQDVAAELYFDDAFHEEGEPLDVSGGWYDAGDYGKYVPPAAATVAQQLLAYEISPGAFSSEQFDLPVDAASGGIGQREVRSDGSGVDGAPRRDGSGADCAPTDPASDDDATGADHRPAMADLLVEVRFELEWLETMQRPDGAVYHKVAGTTWPDIDVRPADDTQTRYVFGLSTFGTAMYAGAMAMAARVFADVDPAFAERALSNARDAHDYLEAHPEPAFRFDEGQDGGSGPYRKETDEEERFWAAAELLKTTGERRYAEYLEAALPEYLEADVTPPTWANALAFGQWAYCTAEAADEDRRARIEARFIEYADDLVAAIEKRGYRCALRTEEYHWASSKLAVTKGNLLLLANEIEPRPAYVETALDQLHYAFGRTPTGYSYLTGAGSCPPRHPHDRLVESTDTAIPGMLVSGANKNGDDPVLAEHIEAHSPPPAKAYVDELEAFSANEWAIDYSAPLVFALGYVAKLEASRVGA